MKKLFFIFFVLLHYVSALAQVDSVTYGISVLQDGTGLYLSKISLPDGIVTKISADSIVQSPGGHGRTIDSRNQIFYYAPGSHLLALDLNTGELIRKIPVSNYPGTTFHGINYNSRDSILYGIAADTAGSGILLAKLDPLTGLVTTISDTSVAASYSALTGTALDPVHGIYYFETVRNPANHLIGVDLHSGGLISDVPIGIDSTDRFGPIAFNCNDSTLYGLTGSYSHKRQFASIDPYTGVVTVLSWFAPADTLLNELATIDPFHKVFYFESADRTYRGVDLTTGDLVSYTKITPLPGSYFTGFIFNNTCYYQSTSTIGEDPTIPELVIFPNPVSDKINIRSSTPLFKVEILDFTGKTVFSEICPGSMEIQVDLTGFVEGIYVVRISNERSSASSKFIKE